MGRFSLLPPPSRLPPNIAAEKICSCATRESHLMLYQQQQRIFFGVHSAAGFYSLPNPLTYETFRCLVFPSFVRPPPNFQCRGTQQLKKDSFARYCSAFFISSLLTGCSHCHSLLCSSSPPRLTIYWQSQNAQRNLVLYGVRTGLE